MSSALLSAAVPGLLRAGPPPPDAVPLTLFTDRHRVADLITVAAGESSRYADDIETATLVIFEAVVDALLVGAVVDGRHRLRAGTRPGVRLDATFVRLDRDLRTNGMWCVRGGARRHRQRSDAAVRHVVTAFASYVHGGASTLNTLATARANVVSERLSAALGLPAAG